MRNNKGFVMIETIIVITILSIGLISLYASYSVILSRAQVKNRHDNVEFVYKAYFVGNYLKDILGTVPNGLTQYNIASGAKPGRLADIMSDFKIERIYLINSDSTNYKSLLTFNKLDGSSIVYFNKWNEYESGMINVVVKFKYIEPHDTHGIKPEINFASVALKRI